jgi:hypothetical protein
MSLAVRLMRLGAIVTLVGLLIPFFRMDAIRDQIEEDNPSFSTDEVDTALVGGLVFAVVLYAIFAGLWLWMASANGKGKTWARTTATVLGVLNFALATLSLVGSGAGMGDPDVFSVILTLVGLAIAATVLFLLYKPESSRFYDIKSGRVGY